MRVKTSRSHGGPGALGPASKHDSFVRRRNASKAKPSTGILAPSSLPSLAFTPRASCSSGPRSVPLASLDSSPELPPFGSRDVTRLYFSRSFKTPHTRCSSFCEGVTGSTGPKDPRPWRLISRAYVYPPLILLLLCSFCAPSRNPFYPSGKAQGEIQE